MEDTSVGIREFSMEIQKLPDGIVVLILKGYLDGYSDKQLQRTFTDFFDNKVYSLIVDMSGVDYIKSGVAGVFISATVIAQENRGNIVIIKPSSRVKEVFDLLGFSQICPITNNMESAIKILKENWIK